MHAAVPGWYGDDCFKLDILTTRFSTAFSCIQPRKSIEDTKILNVRRLPETQYHNRSDGLVCSPSWVCQLTRLSVTGLQSRCWKHPSHGCSCRLCVITLDSLFYRRGFWCTATVSLDWVTLDWESTASIIRICQTHLDTQMSVLGV